ncbi:hypothetical protein BU15DRAFT_77778 [Melanogaster broomeanus]|nr:hypothetical protein BU15DRAFT_77778 [Melanogaster broomeanus]
MSSRSPSPDSKVDASSRAFAARIPFHSGICTVPDHQLFLYYTSQDETIRRLDFSKAEAEELAELYQACKPATFGRNAENVLDETYRKAGKMDLTAFATLFDPHGLGIHREITQGLLTSFRGVEIELYKLNVYGKGDFFKPHKDTPRGRRMIGSLVVVLPTQHEGGQLVLRRGRKEWTVDFADKFAAATEPSACFVAFFGDIEHEVLPVTSGYRVTLAYNLYYQLPSASASYLPSPFHQKLTETLVDLVNDKTTLPNGGYLGFGLMHEYAYNDRSPINWSLVELKGSDQALADVCDKLGLQHSLKLYYRDVCRDFDLLSDKKLEVRDPTLGMDTEGFLMEVLEDFTIDDVEVIEIIGYQLDLKAVGDGGECNFLARFLRQPATQVLEVVHMRSSVAVDSPFVTYGNMIWMDWFYGSACMMIAVDPAESRKLLVL